MRSDVKEGMAREVRIALVFVAALAVALVGYFLAVRPQRAEAARLDQQIAQTQQQLATRRAQLAQMRAARVSAADLRRLETALPDRLNMSRLILELNGAAARAGVTWDSVTPQPAVAVGAYQSAPIAIIVQGRFFDVRKFLHLLRQRASAQSGRVGGKGQLMGVEAFDFAEGEDGFPQIRANITLNAFTFAGAAPPAAATTTPATATTPAGTP